MTTTKTAEARDTYDGWKAKGRQVKSGQRRGPDGKFGESQTKKIGGSNRPRVCAGCGCRISYGMYCGKCEFGR